MACREARDTKIDQYDFLGYFGHRLSTSVTAAPSRDGHASRYSSIASLLIARERVVKLDCACACTASSCSVVLMHLLVLLELESSLDEPGPAEVPSEILSHVVDDASTPTATHFLLFFLRNKHRSRFQMANCTSALIKSILTPFRMRSRKLVSVQVTAIAVRWEQPHKSD